VNTDGVLQFSHMAMSVMNPAGFLMEKAKGRWRQRLQCANSLSFDHVRMSSGLFELFIGKCLKVERQKRV